MDQTLIETGINTIILIDSNGNPNILYQTDSNTWETQGGKEKLYCIKSNGQYTITFFDGTVKQYDSNGFIKKITDRNNNHIIFNRNTDESIKTIESSSGEKLSFCYDGPYIKSITNMRDPLQKTEYSYSNGRLTSVTDTDGDTLTMVYDSKGHMTCVKKSDGSNVNFVYGQTDSQGNALTTQTTNEEGFSEFFIYDPAAKKTIYKDHDGNESVTEYNSNHLTVRETKPDGSTTEYKYDDSNNLIQTNTNGDITRFSYDERGNKTNVLYSDGSTEEYGYDTFGLAVLFRDRDNFLYEYIRDNRGNITEYKENGKTACLQEFDDKGSLIKQTVHQDKTTVTEYEYDRFGNCILKKEGTAVSKYEYDTRNRITKIIQNDQTISSYKYEKKKIVQTDYNGLETTYIINDRKDITRIIQKDTVTGVVHQLQIEYDKRHLPLRVFAGDEKNQKLVASCTYTNEGKLKTQVYHGDETFITAYTFERGALKSVSQFIQGQELFIWEYNFKNKPENKKLLTITNPLGDSSLFDFDASGNLVCHTDENGETTQNIWSPAGRLKEFQISYGGFYNYDEYIKNDTNNVLYEYDCFGRITKQTVVNPQNPSEAVYFVTNEYASDGRSVTVTEGGKYKTVYELDAFGNIIKETDGNGNSRLYEYDFQNQLIAAYDGYMNKTSYEYNALADIKSITLADGSKTNYKYNALGQIIKITDDCGVLYTAEYDKAGRLIKEKTRADSEQAYEYDKAGRLTKVLCGKQIVEAYSYGPRGRTVTVTDGNGSEYFYNYDSFGRCISETNRLGFTQEFPYDNEDDLMGESVISYDAAGNIIEIKNENGQTKYEYDKGGRLILQKDITSGEEIHFEYDSAGNRTHLYSSNRETFYTYGANNEIKEFFDNKQRVRVQLEYNKIGREILRKFANGTTEHACYDKAGRLTLKYQKNSQGELLWGEGYLYSADGKRTATVDNKALVTLYEYNSQGRLSSVYYPCADGNGVNKFLSSNEKSELSLLLNQMNYTLAFSLTTMQVFKKESYTYDKNGNLISKKTPQETIKYNYDKENRLISSSARGQTLVNYTYDKSGNLLKEESDQKVTNCRYNQQNRLIYCEVTDKTTARCTQTKYAYDALGRRIMVQDFDEPPLHTIYDGFTFDVIKQSPSYANGTLTDTYETGIRWGMTGQATGDRYRYIDDQSRKTSSDRYQKERTQFSVNDTIAAQVSYGGKTEYFSTDILGSVRSTTNMYGQQTQALSYDAYGSLLTGNLSGTTDFGYLGKQLDPTTKAYNYGFRDYTPSTARFTTTDPLRDGPNWFTYCNGDPVNFKDLWGLCKIQDTDPIRSDITFVIYRDDMSKLSTTDSSYRSRDSITFKNNKTGDTFTLIGVQTYVSHSKYPVENTLEAYMGGFTIQFLGNNQEVNQLLYNSFSSNFKGPVFNVQYANTKGLGMTDKYGQIIGSDDKAPIRVHSDYNLMETKKQNMASGGCPMYNSEQAEEFNNFLVRNGIKPGDRIKGYIKEYIEP